MEENVSFYSGPGYKLAATFYLPDNYRKGTKVPGILIAGGYRSQKDMFGADTARKFAKYGYGVLNVEFRGFGQSEGPRYRHIAMEQLEDLINGVTYLTTRSEVDSDRIGVWGTSFGGAHAVMLGASDPRVRVVVDAIGFADGEPNLHSTRPEWEWLDFLKAVDEDRKTRVLTGKSRLVSPTDILMFDPGSLAASNERAKKFPELAEMKFPLSETAMAIMNYKPVEHVHKISPRALLIIGAENDFLCPIWHSKVLYEKAGPPKKLVIFNNAVHYDVVSKLLDRSIEISHEWFQLHMPPRPKEATFSA